jgi:hypothetical protein
VTYPLLELRDAADGLQLVGYASVFGHPYEMSTYVETVSPGAFKRTLNEDPDVVLRKMRRGDLNETSFAFQATEQVWNSDYSERTIKGANLKNGDVSIVSRAANPAALATLRSDQLTPEQRQARAEKIGTRVCGPAVPFDLLAPTPIDGDAGRSAVIPVWVDGPGGRDFLIYARKRARELGALRAKSRAEHTEAYLAAMRDIDAARIAVAGERTDI